MSFVHSIDDLSRIATDSLEMQQLKPTSTISNQSFSGQIVFNWSQASNLMLVGQESYIQVKWNACLYEATVGVAAPSSVKRYPIGSSEAPERFSMARNATLSMFNSIKYSLCGKQIDNLNNTPGIVDTFNRVCSSTKSAQDRLFQTGQAVVALPIKQVVQADTVEGSRCQQYVNVGGANASVFDLDLLNGSYCNDTNGPFGMMKSGASSFKPPISLFETESLIQGGTTHELVLSVAPQWRQLLIGASSLASFDNSDVLSNTDASKAATDYAVLNSIKYFIGFDVVDMSLFRAQIKVNPPVRIPRSLHALQYYTYSHVLQASTDQWLTAIPIGTQRVGVVFISSKRGSGGTAAIRKASNTETDFSTGVAFGSNAVEWLSYIRLNINGTQYPATDYSLGPVTGNNDASGDNTSYPDLARAYRDFIINCSACGDRAGTVISYQEWMKQKCFMFQIYTGEQLSEQQCEITFNAPGMETSDANLTTVMLICYTKLKVDMIMDDSKNTTVTSISTVPF